MWSGLVALAVVVLIERSWAEHRRPMTNAEVLMADSATRTFHPTRAEEEDLATARARGMSDRNTHASVTAIDHALPIWD